MKLFNHSYTDDQLLNLLNNQIIEDTEFKLDQFTGGSVSVTSTYNNKFTNYKVSLFFGYKHKKPIARTFDIKEDQLAIWIHAILLKTKNLQINNLGIDQDDMIRKMTTETTVRTNSSTTCSDTGTEYSPKVNSKDSSNKVIVFDDDDEKVNEIWNWILSLSSIGTLELLKGYINYSYSNQNITNPNSLEFSIKQKINKQDRKTLLGIYEYMQKNWNEVSSFDKKDNL
jgi:muramoyltetrapeptide carboxypeptidase LdcA involved in peptidoglycan recycling